MAVERDASMVEAVPAKDAPIAIPSVKLCRESAARFSTTADEKIIFCLGLVSVCLSAQEL